MEQGRVNFKEAEHAASFEMGRECKGLSLTTIDSAHHHTVQVFMFRMPYPASPDRVRVQLYVNGRARLGEDVK